MEPRFNGAEAWGSGGFSVFSLHPRKLLTTGEGGMITTDSAEFAERLRQYGMSASAFDQAFDQHPSPDVTLESYSRP